MRTAWPIAVLEILDLEVEKRFTVIPFVQSSHHTEIDILQLLSIDLAAATSRGRWAIQSYIHHFVS
jgi:hypothetical protein